MLFTYLWCFCQIFVNIFSNSGLFWQPLWHTFSSKKTSLWLVFEVGDWQMRWSVDGMKRLPTDDIFWEIPQQSCRFASSALHVVMSDDGVKFTLRKYAYNLFMFRRWNGNIRWVFLFLEHSRESRTVSVWSSQMENLTFNVSTGNEKYSWKNADKVENWNWKLNFSICHH